jgi:hypothetical protein
MTPAPFSRRPLSILLSQLTSTQAVLLGAFLWADTPTVTDALTQPTHRLPNPALSGYHGSRLSQP